MSEDGAATTEAQAQEGTSAKKGGGQFLVKMIFLALIVLAIVFYVRSLDHKAVPAQDHQTSGETSAPPVQEPAQPAEMAPAAAVPQGTAAEPATEAATAPAEAPLTSEGAMKEIESLFGGN